MRFCVENLIGEQEDWGPPSGSSGQEVEARGPKDEAGFSLVKGSVQGTGHGPGGWGAVGAPARCLPSTTGRQAAGGAVTVPGMSQLPHWIQLNVSSLKSSI